MGKEKNEPAGESQISVSKLPLLFRIKGTVIISTWWVILLVIIYTSGVVYVHEKVDNIKLNVSQALIDILGIVTGLLLAFRTNTAYERYSEGCCVWSKMTCSIRNLTRLIWMGVGNTSDEITTKEKRAAINLLVAFCFATKHYLREEYSHNYDDLRPLIPHLHVFHTPASNMPIALQTQIPQEEDDLEDSDSVSTFDGNDTKSVFTPAKSGLNLNSKNAVLKRKKPVIHPTNLPLELSYYIASFINHCRDNRECDEVTFSQMTNALSIMMECLTSFERILRTPIPLGYSVHLTHMTWIYLLALPYQIVQELGWLTVLVVAVAAFSFLGILEIGREIENPFGYDPNDLPLDDFCKVIKLEIDCVLLQDPADTKEWILSSLITNAPSFHDPLHKGRSRWTWEMNGKEKQAV